MSAIIVVGSFDVYFVHQIGDLDPTITDETLREIFRKYGEIFEEETVVKKNRYVCTKEWF